MGGSLLNQYTRIPSRPDRHHPGIQEEPRAITGTCSHCPTSAHFGPRRLPGGGLSTCPGAVPPDPKRRLRGEAAIERPTSSSAIVVKRHRRDPPASRSPCRQEPEVLNRLKAGGCLLTPTPEEHPVGFPPFRRERRECLPGEGLPASLSLFDGRQRFWCGCLAATAGGTSVCVMGAAWPSCRHMRAMRQHNLAPHTSAL